MAANSANRPFGRKSVASAVEPAKFQAVKPQCHSKSRLLQKETWSGRFLSPFVQRVFRPNTSNASARPLGLEKPSGAILPIQARQDAIASHPCFAAESTCDDPQTNEVDDLFHADGAFGRLRGNGRSRAARRSQVWANTTHRRQVSAIQSYLHDNLRDSMSAVLEYAQPVRDVHVDKPVAGVSHFLLATLPVAGVHWNSRRREAADSV